MPALLIDKLLNVATPLTAATVRVPLKVPPPGFVPMAIVTLLLLPVTTLPLASSTETCTAGVMLAPTAVLLGCVVKATLLAAAAVTLKAVEAAPLRLPSVALRV